MSIEGKRALYDKGDTVILIYALYLVSLVMPIMPAIIAVVWAYLERNNSTEWLQSHYTYIIHTFWKGLLFIAIGMATSVILIGFLVLAAYVLWLIVRCVKGIKAARSKEPVPNPATWLF